jgi:hypothetical protein
MVFRDELVGLLASWDREGNEGDRAFYLEGFNGTGSFNIDRIGRGSLLVKTVCLSVFGGIQPELLERYLADMVNSLDNDGRIQRFQMLVYPEPVAWQWRDRYPVRSARENVRDIFDRLAATDFLLSGAQPANDFIKLPWFAFDDDAQKLFIEWSTDLHVNRIAVEQNPLMRQHLAKFEKLFCSVALILHLAEGRTSAVKRDTAARAAAWCVYMTPEQGDECHADGWNDAEIETFTARSARFIAMGRADAEHVAERLTLRDRQLDRRRMCLECDELETDGRCAAAHRGTLAGVDRRLEPVQNILMRCPAYISSKTYHR